MYRPVMQARLHVQQERTSICRIALEMSTAEGVSRNNSRFIQDKSLQNLFRFIVKV